MLPKIELANSLSLSDFRATYFPLLASASASALSTPPKPEPHLPTPHQTYTITLETASSISPQDLEQCFELIALTSASAYKTSGLGWTPHKKRQEMRLPDLRYLIVKSTTTTTNTDTDRDVEGFCSFMLTYEDGHEVVYCYEVHLAPRMRGMGIGKELMGLLEGVGREVGVEKAMLTVFVENVGARRFYEGLGYGVDEYSPQVRRLRGGVVKRPTYVILSKKLQVSSKGESV